MRIGFGYDVHRLIEGRKLILGGVLIEHSAGLLGHSDADVLSHAVIDALLGAAALGDIGTHYPDSDENFRDADSLMLLRDSSEKIRHAGYQIGNIDVTVVAQRPRIAAHILQMRRKLAEASGIAIDSVNIKATTEEGLGFTGNEEGISAYAICLLL